jgi:hypothetical protein
MRVKPSRAPLISPHFPLAACTEWRGLLGMDDLPTRLRSCWQVLHHRVEVDRQHDAVAELRSRLNSPNAARNHAPYSFDGQKASTERRASARSCTRRACYRQTPRQLCNQALKIPAISRLPQIFFAKSFRDLAVWTPDSCGGSLNFKGSLTISGRTRDPPSVPQTDA